MDNWDNLKIYLAVARSGTVSAAAQELGVSHATVLRRIDQFEQELGTKLFKRLQSGYQLSQEGKALFEEAQNVEAATLRIQRQFEGGDEQLAGTLRITQPENEVVDLYPIYAKFIKRYPDITLEISSTAKVSNLNRQDADVALRFTLQPDDLLVGRCLGPVNFGAYASKAYLKNHSSNRSDKKGGTPDLGLSDCDWILWQPDSNRLDKSAQYDWLKKRMEEPRIIMRTSSVSDIISAIRSGIGVGFVSHPIAAHYPDLVALPNARFTSMLKLWILTHRDLRNQARVKCFMRFVADELMLNQ